jgi:hypothetical protein
MIKRKPRTHEVEEGIEMSDGYFLRFVRNDCGPVEEFFYHSYDEAYSHLSLFQDDDSELYQRIEIVRACCDDEVVTSLAFSDSDEP